MYISKPGNTQELDYLYEKVKVRQRSVQECFGGGRVAGNYRMSIPAGIVNLSLVSPRVPTVEMFNSRSQGYSVNFLTRINLSYAI